MYDPEKECKVVIERIQKICLMRGMTRNELARKAGISNSTLSYIISGKSKPSVYTLLLLCNALNIAIEELFSDYIKNEELEKVEKNR